MNMLKPAVHICTRLLVICTRLLVVLGVAALAACATQPVSDPAAAKRDILIITGDGHIPTYPQDPRAENLWKTVAGKYANALATELRNAGHPVRVYINHEKGKGVKDTVPYLLAQRAHNAVIQVRVRHVKNSGENTVYLHPSYFSLRYVQNPDGRRSAVPENEIDRPEPMLSASGRDKRNVSLQVMAREFVAYLHSKGALGGP